MTKRQIILNDPYCDVLMKYAAETKQLIKVCDTCKKVYVTFNQYKDTGRCILCRETKKSYYVPKPRVEKPCEHCGKVFTAKGNVARFCCTKCQVANLNIRHKKNDFIIKKCLSCGKEYKALKHTQKYCSSECYRARYSNYTILGSRGVERRHHDARGV